MKCDRYADLIALSTLLPKACDYPFQIDAASPDATTASTDDDAGGKGKR